MRAGEPVDAVDRTDSGVEWLGRHAREAVEGVTLVFGDGASARIVADAEPCARFQSVADRMLEALAPTATNSGSRFQ